MVWTAAHCVVRPGGVFVTHFVFVPAYYNGSRPYGTWGAEYATVPNPFLYFRNYDYDYAAVNVFEHNGTHLTNVVGGNGLRYNYGTPRMTIWGYPSGGNYNGQVPYYCQDIPTYTYGSRIRTGCSMTKGASGGPWLTSYNRSTDLGYITGNTSTTAKPKGYIASPYYDDHVDQTYNQAKNK
jgi:hypothetical protein